MRLTRRHFVRASARVLVPPFLGPVPDTHRVDVSPAEASSGGYVITFGSKQEAVAAETGRAEIIAVDGLLYKADPEAWALQTGDNRSWMPFGTTDLRHYDDGFASLDRYGRGKKVQIGPGHYETGTFDLADSGLLAGAGSNVTRITRDAPGNLINSPRLNEAGLSGAMLDMQRTRFGDGHGISASGEGLRFEDLEVRGFGSSEGGGGAGVLVFAETGKSRSNRLRNVTLEGDPEAEISFGWILANTEASFVHQVSARNIITYAHELKNDATHNLISDLLTENSGWSLVYGQETPDQDGADHNLAHGVLARASDGGVLVGEGAYNLFSTVSWDGRNAPGHQNDGCVVKFSGGAQGNAAFAVMSYGLPGADESIRISGDANYVQIAAHDTAPDLVHFTPGSARNVVEIAHPGARRGVLEAIVDDSGYALDVEQANVVSSQATGERIGSLSGHFHDRLGVSGGTPLASHKWRREHNRYVLEALMVPGTAGDIAGWSVVSQARDDLARLWYVKGDHDREDYWKMGAGGTDSILTVSPSSVRSSRPVQLPSYSKEALPSATEFEGAIAYIREGDSGEPSLAVSDGKNWRSLSLGKIVK